MVILERAVAEVAVEPPPNQTHARWVDGCHLCVTPRYNVTKYLDCKEDEQLEGIYVFWKNSKPQAYGSWCMMAAIVNKSGSKITANRARSLCPDLCAFSRCFTFL